MGGMPTERSMTTDHENGDNGRLLQIHTYIHTADIAQSMTVTMDNDYGADFHDGGDEDDGGVGHLSSNCDVVTVAEGPSETPDSSART